MPIPASRPAFAPWWVPAGPVDADRVQLVLDIPQISAEDVGADPVTVAPRFPWLQKAAVARITADGGRVLLHSAPVDFETARWAGTHEAAIRSARPELDPDDPAAPAWPGIAAVHVLAVTADGVLIAGQRATDAAFFPAAWSLSFEEQLEAGAGADATVGAAARRGALEELGVPVERVLALAAGRDADPHTGAPIGVAVLCVARLAGTFADVAAEVGGAADRHEFAALAGLAGMDLRRLTAAVTRLRGAVDGPTALAAACGATCTVLPLTERSSDAGWHPTAAPRLAFAARPCRGPFLAR